ncbi:MAG: anthranilate phosphoribosyltransferase [Hyphomicrobiales bacterium]|nr:anthranilate phosphoribosyltransferase [Hyphomicrobiales bacterium]MCP5000122.1 anthranilate phosphoribosyltransferase [Hyphomicrobiales bacterium]
MSELKDYIAIAASGQHLTREQAQEAFTIMMSGEATAAQIGGFLMALRVRGESVSEIAGAVATMREKMLRVNAPDHAVDIVGTGGDASGSYNVSTCAALVAAGAGLTVAKHGNRALTSKSGAADTLTALNVAFDLAPESIEACISEAGIGFMFAPGHHAAMRHVGPARVELGTRTIFNLLGPLSNPASVKRQLLGVFDAAWTEPLAEVLRDLGSETVWVVHGDGLDEMTTTGTTHVVALESGNIRKFEVTPEEFGLQRVTLDQLKGGDAEHNAAALLDVLQGAKCPYRDIVLLNTGAALVVGGLAEDIQEGIKLAEEAIDGGAAKARLDALVKTSNIHARKEQ